MSSDPAHPPRPLDAPDAPDPPTRSDREVLLEKHYKAAKALFDWSTARAGAFKALIEMQKITISIERNRVLKEQILTDEVRLQNGVAPLVVSITSFEDINDRWQELVRMEEQLNEVLGSAMKSLMDTIEKAQALEVDVVCPKDPEKEDE